MASAPTRCFDGCRNFCDLLPEMVDGGGRWLADDFVNDKCVDGFLFLLTRKVVQAHDQRSICEHGGVREARGNDRRCWKAIDHDIGV